MACESVGYFLHTRMTEYAAHIAEATVEQAVGLIIVEAAVVEPFEANGFAHGGDIGLVDVAVSEHVAAACYVSECHGSCHAKFCQGLLPYDAGRHARISFEAIVVCHDNSFAGIGVIMGVLGAAIGNFFGLGMGAILQMLA